MPQGARLAAWLPFFACVGWLFACIGGGRSLSFQDVELNGANDAGLGLGRWGNYTEDCGFGKGDILHLTELPTAENYSVFDPRFENSPTVIHGFAARAVQLFRKTVSNQIHALELSGPQAVDLIQAQYGIVAAQVPSRCFPLLRQALDTDGLDWSAITKRRAKLRALVAGGLPRACAPAGSNITHDEERRGLRAQKLLEVLRWGYWSLYANRTLPGQHVISARVLDEKRFKAGKHHLRQIWHFGKMFRLTNLEGVLLPGPGGPSEPSGGRQEPARVLGFPMRPLWNSRVFQRGAGRSESNPLIPGGSEGAHRLREH